MAKKSSSVLVTGGLGVVGRPLVAELKKRGHKVSVADVGHYHEDHYHRLDIGSAMQVARLFENNKFDYVYNLAAEFGRHNGEDYYDRLWNSNAIGMKNILRAQEKHKFRLIHFSSSEVYGDYDGVMTEEVMMDHPIRQLNDYAITKWVNEQQIMNSQDRFKTETVRVRLFNTYGPGELYSAYRSVICRFCYCALHDLPYTVFLDHTRSSTYIDDCVKTLATICEKFNPGRVYNIGGTEHHDIKSLSDIILKHLGKTDKKIVTYKKVDEHNTRHKKVDCSRAEKELGHENKTPLVEGIKRTLEWMKGYYRVG